MYVCFIFSYVVQFRDTYTVNKKRTIEAPTTSLEYQNLAAKMTDDEDDKKASAVENDYVMKVEIVQLDKDEDKEIPWTTIS